MNFSKRIQNLWSNFINISFNGT